MSGSSLVWRVHLIGRLPGARAHHHTHMHAAPHAHAIIAPAACDAQGAPRVHMETACRRASDNNKWHAHGWWRSRAVTQKATSDRLLLGSRSPPSCACTTKLPTRHERDAPQRDTGLSRCIPVRVHGRRGQGRLQRSSLRRRRAAAAVARAVRHSLALLTSVVGALAIARPPVASLVAVIPPASLVCAAHATRTVIDTSERWRGRRTRRHALHRVRHMRTYAACVRGRG